MGGREGRGKGKGREGGGGRIGKGNGKGRKGRGKGKGKGRGRTPPTAFSTNRTLRITGAKSRVDVGDRLRNCRTENIHTLETR